jgi:hypothetical protein
MVEDAFIDCRRPYASDFIIDIVVLTFGMTLQIQYEGLTKGSIQRKERSKGSIMIGS